MAEPKLLIPLNEQRSSGLSKGAQAVLHYNSTRNDIKKGKLIQTPELDRAVGNAPNFVAPTSTQSEDFVAPSSKSENKLTNEEQMEMTEKITQVLTAIE